jgi:CubicO group peptidase (beta-lactamase class C family)
MHLLARGEAWVSFDIEKVDAVIEPVLRKARIPGAAVAVVFDDVRSFCRGYGYRDLYARLPMCSDTFYPIASTTKAINATLLGMLVDEGRLAWDAEVQAYLPRFRLREPLIGSAVTVRDLITMRTGLPRHDFVWTESGIDLAGLVECIAHLPLSAGLRERFQYNNLTASLAGHIAEIVTGQSWEELVRQRILEPLGMARTGFAPPTHAPLTTAYHETAHRELRVTRPLRTEPIAPAGGALYSTVREMSKWVAFNLNNGRVSGRQLIQLGTLQEIHTPYVLMGGDSVAPSSHAAYGLGWFVDTYNGCRRISHTGYLHDINGCVSLFPDQLLGIVSFNNFAAARLAPFINECVFNLLLDLLPPEKVEERLGIYEKKVEESRRRNSSVRRVENTSPSHPLEDYVGTYRHPGYGRIVIGLRDGQLVLERNALALTLQHWHYDVWIVAPNDLFEIHKRHPFERSNRFRFEIDVDGRIAAVYTQLEPTVPPQPFMRESVEPMAGPHHR